MHTFSAAACVRFGWQTFKKRGWFFVGVTALMMVASWAIGALAAVFGNQGTPSFAGTIVNMGLSTLLSMGFVAVMLHAHDAVESADVKSLWHPQAFWKFLVAELLTSTIVVIGFVLLIVPGLIAVMTLIFVPYIVIDKEPNPIEALKESMRITKGSRWEIALLVLMIAGLNILGALAILVGLLVTVPLTTLALVHAYRTLEANAKAPA